nr:heterodisulfide reductase-related iron-sulfur binding cluster [uncultured Desulfobacter sp.]
MSTASKDLVLKIFDKCAGSCGCDVCRTHLDEDCLFFTELYRLNDELLEQGGMLRNKTVSQLLELCTMCGLCPCPDIRMLILQAKAANADENGIPLADNVVADIQKTGKLGTLLSHAVNRVNRCNSTASIVKKALKIDPDRQLPKFPDQNFFQWVKNKGLYLEKRESDNTEQKVAYFAGCSAGYFFPEVGKATVSFLESLGIKVFVPEQNCCGMPLLMEGRKQKALEKIRTNIETLMQAVNNGYKIICSCPTCGYLYKKLLLENAYFSQAAQERLQTQKNEIKVPLGSGAGKFLSLPKAIYQKVFKDDGYFSSIDPMDRIDLSQAVLDLGEFLLSFQQAHDLTFRINTSETSSIYFASCHQREQDIGQPYLKIFSAIPEADMIQVGGALSCCGMGGHLGYKKSFHKKSLKTGQSLFNALESEKDRTIVTDCLSCRLQFSQVFDRKIVHPIELLEI